MGVASRAPAPYTHTRKRGSPERSELRRRRSPGRPSRRQGSVSAAGASDGCRPCGATGSGGGSSSRRRRQQRWCLVAAPVARRGRARRHRRGARARRRRRGAGAAAAAAAAGRARPRPASASDAPDSAGAGAGAAGSVPWRAAAAVGQVGGGDPGPGEGGAGVARHLRHRRGRRARLRRRRAPLQGRQGQAQLPRGSPPCRCRLRALLPAPGRHGDGHGFDVGGAGSVARNDEPCRWFAEHCCCSCWRWRSGGVPGPQQVRTHPAERRRPGPAGHRRLWWADAGAVLDYHGVSVGISIVPGAVGGLVAMARSYLTRCIQIRW